MDTVFPLVELEDSLLDFKMVVLSHNTVIGAAGSGILIAEILKARGLI